MNNTGKTVAKWTTTRRLYVSVWVGNQSHEDTVLPAGTDLMECTGSGDKSSFFRLRDGREVDIRHEDDSAIKEVK